jgi:hypothetical protein
MAKSEWKSDRCGQFLMQGAGRHWVFTCEKLGDWRQEVICTEDEAGQLLINLQAEYRDQL